MIKTLYSFKAELQDRNKSNVVYSIEEANEFLVNYTREITNVIHNTFENLISNYDFKNKGKVDSYEVSSKSKNFCCKVICPIKKYRNYYPIKVEVSDLTNNSVIFKYEDEMCLTGNKSKFAKKIGLIKSAILDSYKNGQFNNQTVHKDPFVENAFIELKKVITSYPKWKQLTLEMTDKNRSGSYYSSYCCFEFDPKYLSVTIYDSKICESYHGTHTFQNVPPEILGVIKRSILTIDLWD
ncbi:hypothetical protein [Cohnella abietis]|uniref:Uncharacterized protein n=1 Tax=Cohnella abietis TaxID=2507935 RepID=A0A3T1CY02_9BACL|nr:hypothetical protein [Cohnella abietis]BBI30742.1 hypothetical protein KCTCHS21_01410 [Cohnella abietis]